VPITAQAIYEQTLVVRSQIGDEAAFQELLTLYAPRLHAFARKMLGADASGRAEDLLQETWVTIFRRLPTLLDVTRFRAWAFRIARDRIYLEFRRRKLAVDSLDEIDPDELREPEPAAGSFDAEELHRCLNALTPSHREVLLLRYFEDMNYEEIARVTGNSVGTVRSRIHYAKRALRSAVEETIYENKSK
jgi:RNA polymerase sigma-70 factor (ECF subfamily)